MIVGMPSHGLEWSYDQVGAPPPYFKPKRSEQTKTWRVPCWTPHLLWCFHLVRMIAPVIDKLGFLSWQQSGYCVHVLMFLQHLHTWGFSSTSVDEITSRPPISSARCRTFSPRYQVAAAIWVKKPPADDYTWFDNWFVPYSCVKNYASSSLVMVW